MASPLAQGVKAAQIAEWQSGLEAFRLVNDVDLTRQAFNCCIAAAKTVVSHLRHGNAPSRSAAGEFERQVSRLVLWGHDHHVQDGGLDAYLERSPLLRRLVLESLSEVGDILGLGLLPLLEPSLPQKDFDPQLLEALVAKCREAATQFADADNEGERSVASSLEEAVKDFATEVKILVDLETVLILLRAEKAPAIPAITASTGPQEENTQSIQGTWMHSGILEPMELVENEPTARPFQCDWASCGKSFNRKSDLQRHYRIHTHERPYACNVPGCGKSFIQRSALTVHIRTHTGEKPHQCQHIGCGRRFSDASTLATHRRIHTRMRPYKCAHDGCLKSFCRISTLAKHQIRSHQNGIPSEENDESISKTSSQDDSLATPMSRTAMQTPPPKPLPSLSGPHVVPAATHARLKLGPESNANEHQHAEHANDANANISPDTTSSKQQTQASPLDAKAIPAGDPEPAKAETEEHVPMYPIGPLRRVWSP